MSYQLPSWWVVSLLLRQLGYHQYLTAGLLMKDIELGEMAQLLRVLSGLPEDPA